MEEKLKELLKKSYSPYSQFPVACIITMTDGIQVSGVNVENASYGATICAERSAIVSAVSQGYQKEDFKALDIMVDQEKISTCCFSCRQVISEFFKEDALVTCYNNQGDKKSFTVKELCPYPFNEGDLQ